MAKIRRTLVRNLEAMASSIDCLFPTKMWYPTANMGWWLCNTS
ncbi:hypothetical protein Hanom_Chr07g00583481 [Helianthus anomalus]